MKITIANTEQEFDCTAAWRVIGQMLEHPASVIGLSTGRTTGNMHRLIAEIHERYPFPVGETTFFGLDEVIGVSRHYSGACYTMLKTELIDALGVDEEYFLMLPTQCDDFPRACVDFRQEIARRGGIDLLILGLGENGHLGFNQPGSPLGRRGMGDAYECGVGGAHPTGDRHSARGSIGWSYVGHQGHHAGASHCTCGKRG